MATLKLLVGVSILLSIVTSLGAQDADGDAGCFYEDADDVTWSECFSNNTQTLRRELMGGENHCPAVKVTWRSCGPKDDLETATVRSDGLNSKSKNGKDPSISSKIVDGRRTATDLTRQKAMDFNRGKSRAFKPQTTLEGTSKKAPQDNFFIRKSLGKGGDKEFSKHGDSVFGHGHGNSYGKGKVKVDGNGSASRFWKGSGNGATIGSKGYGKDNNKGKKKCNDFDNRFPNNFGFFGGFFRKRCRESFLRLKEKDPNSVGLKVKGFETLHFRCQKRLLRRYQNTGKFPTADKCEEERKTAQSEATTTKGNIVHMGHGRGKDWGQPAHEFGQSGDQYWRQGGHKRGHGKAHEWGGGQGRGRRRQYGFRGGFGF